LTKRRSEVSRERGEEMSVFVVLLICACVSVSAVAPLVIAGGVVAVGGGMYAYIRPAAYYKGNLEVCITSQGEYGANPWFGLTTCGYPNIRVTLGKKERIQLEGLEVTTIDGKRGKIFLDSTLISYSLEDVQNHLVEEFYIQEVPFKEAVLTNPIKHCIMTEINQITYEDLFKDTKVDETFRNYITKCMESYSTSYVPTKNTYVKLRRIS
jgi:hypothetical protein